MNVIGKYLSSLASGWDTPGFWSGEMNATTYVPDASESMTDDELAFNYNEVLWRLNFWKNYGAVYNSTEANNIKIVIAGYTQKLAGYQTILDERAAKQILDTNTGDNTGSNDNTNDGSSPKNKTLLWFLIGGGLLWYAYKRKLFKSK